MTYKEHIQCFNILLGICSKVTSNKSPSYLHGNALKELNDISLSEIVRNMHQKLARLFYYEIELLFLLNVDGKPRQTANGGAPLS